MTDSQGGGDEEDLADVYQDAPVHGLKRARTKTNFQPWHHPRKQVVRLEQWCAEARKLIPELGLGQGDPFRYLTLPGNELLDVRALHGVCEKAGVKLRYTGFNSVGRRTPEAAELALSQSEVRSLSFIDEFSTVLHYRLEAVSNERSPAHRSTISAGPFHAINLDLCESIAFREIGHRKGSPLEAAGTLLKLQLQSAAPWLLFITTKADPDLVAPFARDGFNRALDANSAASESFKAKLVALLATTVDQLDTDLASAWLTHDVRFLKLLSAGIGKWLLSILANAAPPRGLALLSACYYQSGPHGPDMLSLAFRCEKAVHGLQDPNAILPPAPQPVARSEVELGIALAAAADAMTDLDARMADPAFREKIIDKAARLMATARFGEEDYKTWASTLFPESQSA
jgi:hypothetical protein